MRYTVLNVGTPSLGVPIKPILGEIGSLVGGIGSLASAFLGSKSQAESNRINKEIADEANALNYRMFNEANDFNRQERLETQDFNRNMWYEQQNYLNAYNSPAMQAERLRAAGLNPSVNGLDGGNVQSVGSVTSSPASSVSPQSAVTYQHQPTFNSLEFSSSVNQFANAMKAFNESEGVAINNETLQQRNALELDNLIADTEAKLASKDVSVSQKRVLQSQLKSMKLERARIKLGIRDTNSRLRMAEDVHQKMMRKFDDEHTRMDLDTKAAKLAYDIESKYGMQIKEWQLKGMQSAYRKVMAEIGLIGASTTLTKAQAEHEGWKQAETILRSAGISSQNAHFDNIKSDLAEQIRNELMVSNSEARNVADYDNWSDSNWFTRGARRTFNTVGGLANSLGIRLKF